MSEIVERLAEIGRVCRSNSRIAPVINEAEIRAIWTTLAELCELISQRPITTENMSKSTEADAGILVPKENQVPKNSYPTLEWFRSLPEDDQQAIWGRLRSVLKWELWIKDSHAGGGRCLDELFAELRRCGASWEVYT